jgi:hypothetical protein
MEQHPAIQRQIIADRHRAMRQQAEQIRVRRDARAAERQRRKAR